MNTTAEAVVEDLYRVKDQGKAELLNGKLIVIPPTGGVTGRASGRIYLSLDQYERERKAGFALPDNVGFVVYLPHRKSFSPDAAYFIGELKGGDFLAGAPVFAVEVRSKFDYGERADLAIAQKRADYLACGTEVVWDVDVLREKLVRVYRASAPDQPSIYRKGERAEAEPALPGWSIAVDDFIP